MPDTDPNAPAAVPATVRPMPDPTFADPAAGRKEVKLAFPVRLPDGRIVSSVFLRRLTMGQIRTAYANLDAARQSNSEAQPDFQLFRDEAGKPLSDADLDYLEADDFDAVDTAAADFLPRRLRAASTSPAEASPSGSTPATGEPIAE